MNQLKDIKLTLDIKLQQSVREKLKKTVDLYKAESGLAIVVDMQNGEVLASVSLPDFNPNIKSTYNNNNLINRVIQSNYEMGSTFKPITVAMGFDKNLLNSDMKFDVKESINGISDYNDYKGNGIYDIEKIIIESSNIGTAQIATLIGDGPSILKEVSMVGNDMMMDPGIGTCGKAGQGVPVGVAQPSILINKMTVGGTKL